MSLFDFARNGSLGGTTRATAPASGERPAQPASSDREGSAGGVAPNLLGGTAPARGQAWLGNIAALLVLGITVAGFFKSWHGLEDLACRSGAVPCSYAWLFPFVTDAMVLVAEIGIWIAHRRGVRVPRSWAFLVLYATLSIAGNGWDVMDRGWVAVAIAVLFPATAFLAFPEVLRIFFGTATQGVTEPTVATAGRTSEPTGLPSSEVLPALVKFPPPPPLAAVPNGASVEKPSGVPSPALANPPPPPPANNGHTPLGPYNGGQKAKALVWLQEHPGRVQAAPSKTALIAECAAATGVSKGTAANALKEFRTPTNEGA